MALPVLVIGLAACSTDRTHSGERRAEAGRTGGEATVAADASTTGTEAGRTGTAGGEMGTRAEQEGLRGHPSDEVISGRVTSASDDSLEIESMDGRRQELSVVDETLVTIEGRDGSIEDIQEGQQVRASYNRIDGRDIAVRVEAGQSGMGQEGGAVRHGNPPLPDVNLGKDAREPPDGTEGPRPGGGRRTGDRG